MILGKGHTLPEAKQKSTTHMYYRRECDTYFYMFDLRRPVELCDAAGNTVTNSRKCRNWLLSLSGWIWICVICSPRNCFDNFPLFPSVFIVSYKAKVDTFPRKMMAE